MSNITSLITMGTVQAAFIAVSSRIVGSIFRFGETLNPRFQKTRVISDPKTVLVRELVTTSMAWGFALTTNMVIKPLAERRGWSPFGVQFMTAAIGTTLAELVGRYVAYRKAVREDKYREGLDRDLFYQTKELAPQIPRPAFRANSVALEPHYNRSAKPLVRAVPSIMNQRTWGNNLPSGQASVIASSYRQGNLYAGVY